MKTVAVIGSTGSVGTATLEIIKKYKKLFKVVFLYADKNYKKINKQCKIFKPYEVSLNNKEYLKKIKTKSNILNSIDQFIKKTKKIDYVVSAMSGYSGLKINFDLLKITKNLLIANKETIICGGKFFLTAAKKNKCKILPIDSEHYCINYFLNYFKNKNFIKMFYLTASGGPFFKKKIPFNVSLKKVLKHPNWKMGKKISVNSANLTNKIMELFEAKILFDIPINKLNIRIEKSSKVHCVISLVNGLDFFISHKTSMKIPIENSLLDKFNLSKINKNIVQNSEINFILSKPKYLDFPIIKTGFKVLKLGHAGMIIFTIVNDRLVEMFLNRKKKFNDISKILIKIFKNYKIVKYSKRDITSLTDINKIINFAKNINI